MPRSRHPKKASYEAIKSSKKQTQNWKKKEKNSTINKKFVLKHRIKTHICLCSSLNDAISLAFS